MLHASRIDGKADEGPPSVWRTRKSSYRIVHTSAVHSTSESTTIDTSSAHGQVMPPIPKHGTVRRREPSHSKYYMTCRDGDARCMAATRTFRLDGYP